MARTGLGPFADDGSWRGSAGAIALGVFGALAAARGFIGVFNAAQPVVELLWGIAALLRVVALGIAMMVWQLSLMREDRGG